MSGSADKKKAKLPAHEQVAEFMRGLEHPLKREIEEVRAVILQTEPRLTEQIKWNAPSFCYNGDDRMTFNLHGKGFFRLIFHRGAKVKSTKSPQPLFEDRTGLLEWPAADRAILQFTDMNDVRDKKEALAYIVKTWIELTGD